MIDKLLYYTSENTDPYRNLATEEYLLRHVGEGQCILYLWQNSNTVVIGRNQNAYAECNLKNLDEDGGHLARRLSGGGAVYHDMGNQNFTFLVGTDDYDLDKQLSVIVEAVSALGIVAEKTGRNDITADGRKFSGNAFYKKGEISYHHGTIMVDVDRDKLGRYLNVSAEKLKSNGVASVKSRVVNLKELNPDITTARLRDELIKAFGKVYGVEPESAALTGAETDELKAHYKSWEWRYGRKIQFQYEISRRFPWGEVTMEFQVDGGVIKECRICTDSMEPFIFEDISRELPGCRFEVDAVCRHIAGCSDAVTGCSDAVSGCSDAVSDIIKLVREEL